MHRHRFRPDVIGLESRIALDAAPGDPPASVMADTSGIELPDLFGPYPICPAPPGPGTLTVIRDGLSDLWDSIVSYGSPPGPSAPPMPPAAPSGPTLAPAPALPVIPAGDPTLPDDPSGAPYDPCVSIADPYTDPALMVSTA